MKKSNLLMMAILAISVVLSVTSCSFATQNVSSDKISDISDKINYRSISTNAYMGGSVLYNPMDLSTSQLAQGVYVATRLGKVAKKVVSDDDTIYTDIEDEASYGYIYINSISEKALDFSYIEYSKDGTHHTEKSFLLGINQTIDLNGDGFANLS